VPLRRVSGHFREKVESCVSSWGGSTALQNADSTAPGRFRCTGTKILAERDCRRVSFSGRGAKVKAKTGKAKTNPRVVRSGAKKTTSLSMGKLCQKVLALEKENKDLKKRVVTSEGKIVTSEGKIVILEEKMTGRQSVSLKDDSPVSTTPSDFVTKLEGGKWCEAFESADSAITNATDKILSVAVEDVIRKKINKIFMWEKDMSPIIKRGYAEQIEKCAKLNVGRKLIRDIIDLRMANPLLSSIEFVCDENTEHQCDWRDYPDSCRINIKWDMKKHRHVGDEWLMLVNDKSAGGGKVGFVRVAVSPPISHELGHVCDGWLCREMFLKNLMGEFY
jgi:hypothetical protein